MMATTVSLALLGLLVVLAGPLVVSEDYYWRGQHTLSAIFFWAWIAVVVALAIGCLAWLGNADSAQLYSMW